MKGVLWSSGPQERVLAQHPLGRTRPQPAYLFLRATALVALALPCLWHCALPRLWFLRQIWQKDLARIVLVSGGHNVVPGILGAGRSYPFMEPRSLRGRREDGLEAVGLRPARHAIEASGCRSQSSFRIDLCCRNSRLSGMAYSQDLRERVIAAVRAKRQSLDQIAQTFGVSAPTVDNWVRRWRETGRVAALPWAGGVKRSLRDCGPAIRKEVRQQPDATLEELCARVEAATGVRSNPSMTPAPNRRCGVCRELQRLDLPRKKKSSTIINGTRRA